MEVYNGTTNGLARFECSNSVVFMHTQRQWHKDKRWLWSCCQNGKYGPLYVSYSNYTNCKKSSFSSFFFFLVLFFLSSNACQVSLQSFNSCQKITSAIHHQLTFEFIFLQAVFLMPFNAEFTRRRKICEENKEITGMVGICLMSYEMNKKKRRRKIHLPTLILSILRFAALASLFITLSAAVCAQRVCIHAQTYV